MRQSSPRGMLAASIVLLAMAGQLTLEKAIAQTSSDALLRRMDANGNGRLESGEAPSQYRLIIDRAARKAGLDPSKPISIEQLKRGLQRSPEGQGSREDRPGDHDRSPFVREHPDRADRHRSGRHSWGDGSRSAQPVETAPGVPGFGVVDDLPPVAGFDGQPLDESTWHIPLEKRYESKVLEYIDGRLLRPHDLNKDGFLDREEMKRIPWADDPQQDDANNDGRLSRAELAGRMARRWHYGRKRVKVSGSGSKPVSASSSSSSSSAKSGSSGLAERYQRYASSLLKRYDKNNNGFLERDEWKEMRGESAKADRNRDGRITSAELAAHLAAYSSRKESESKPSSSGASSNRDRSGSERDRRGRWLSGRSRSSDKSAERTTYRFSSPAERLSGDLPGWFKEKDTNADGQVAMAEYSSAWSESEVTAFKKNDLNGDGLITPRECLIAESIPSQPNPTSKPVNR